jgi:hypothetical protein
MGHIRYGAVPLSLSLILLLMDRRNNTKNAMPIDPDLIWLCLSFVLFSFCEMNKGKKERKKQPQIANIYTWEYGRLSLRIS